MKNPILSGRVVAAPNNVAPWRKSEIRVERYLAKPAA